MAVFFFFNHLLSYQYQKNKATTDQTVAMWVRLVLSTVMLQQIHFVCCVMVLARMYILITKEVQGEVGNHRIPTRELSGLLLNGT